MSCLVEIGYFFSVGLQGLGLIFLRPSRHLHIVRLVLNKQLVACWLTPHHHQKGYLSGVCPWHSARCFLEGLNLLMSLPFENNFKPCFLAAYAILVTVILALFIAFIFLLSTICICTLNVILFIFRPIVLNF